MRPYRRFMLDFMEEYRADELQYLSPQEDIDAQLIDEKKEDVFIENYYFMNNLQKVYVTPALSKMKTRNEIIQFTAQFIDNHARQLSTNGPVYKFTFGNKDIGFLYETFNIDADKILEIYNGVVEETYHGDISKFFTGWVKSAPHKLVLIAMLIDAIQNGYEEIVECFEYLFMFTEYPIMYQNFWSTGVREDVMNYTISRMSSKFKVKKLNNLKELLKYDSTKAVELKMEELRKGVDNVYLDLMYSIRSRINSTFKNISREYYNSIEMNATQHNNVSTFDDGEIADQEGHSSNSAQVIDGVIEKFALHEINPSMLRVAADGSSVDKGNLSGYLSSIYSDKSNRLNKFIENIIGMYFIKYPSNTGINAGEFLNFSFALYRSIGTSKDETLKELKDILNHWMNDVINIKQYYQREATIIAYTRAIYNYFCMMINYYA